VTRNRIRRIVREIFRHEKRYLQPGIDLVLVVKACPEKEEMRVDSMKKHFENLCKKAGIWNCP